MILMRIRKISKMKIINIKYIDKINSPILCFSDDDTRPQQILLALFFHRHDDFQHTNSMFFSRLQ